MDWVAAVYHMASLTMCGGQHRGPSHESVLRAFTEFRTKTEFSDLLCAGNWPKSKVFRPGTRGWSMAPPLPKPTAELNLCGRVSGRAHRWLARQRPRPPTKSE